MKKLLILLLTICTLIIFNSCDNSTPKIPDDHVANRIIDAYSSFLIFIGGNEEDNRLDISGNLDTDGSATVNSDIVNGDYTYKKGCYVSLQTNGNVEIRMTYVKDTVNNTLFFKGYNGSGGIQIPEQVVFNNVVYDLNSWMKQQNH